MLRVWSWLMGRRSVIFGLFAIVPGTWKVSLSLALLLDLGHRLCDVLLLYRKQVFWGEIHAARV